MNTIFWLVASYILTRLLLPAIIDLLAGSSALQINWQGNKTTGSAGIVFPLVFFLMFLSQAREGSVEDWLFMLLALFGTAFFGLLDDWLGNTETKGLKGHFSFFWRQGRITSGFLKALGIALLSLVVVAQGKGLGFWLLADWLLLILSVNLINLLDLRPGRALKVVLCIGLGTVLTGAAAPFLSGLTLGMGLAFLPYDLAGAAMLGDVGSNCLGMLTGLMLLGAPRLVKLFVLSAFLTLHVVAEFYSLSRLIAANHWLTALDNWGRPAGLREGESLLNVERITKR